MSVSDQDRRRMTRLARALAAVESDHEAKGDMLDRAVATANQHRKARGLPPLAAEPAPPELELYRRARALGLRRRRG